MKSPHRNQSSSVRDFSTSFSRTCTSPGLQRFQVWSTKMLRSRWKAFMVIIYTTTARHVTHIRGSQTHWAFICEDALVRRGTKRNAHALVFRSAPCSFCLSFSGTLLPFFEPFTCAVKVSSKPGTVHFIRSKKAGSALALERFNATPALNQFMVEGA